MKGLFNRANWEARWRRHSADIAEQGVLGWFLVTAQERAPGLQRLFRRRVWPKTSSYPLAYRPGSSDLKVYQQIFVEREYRALDHLQTDGLILDCGANVGYSSAYFLSRYPKATVIAVEPDAANFELLRRNTAAYGKRIRAIKAGIWSRSCGLKVVHAGVGVEWGVTVRECRADQGETSDVEAVDIATLLKDSGFERISILKMDIERSELEVFRPGCTEWLSKCDAIAIELHGSDCEALFREAVSDQGFRFGSSGELTICTRDAVRRD